MNENKIGRREAARRALFVLGAAAIAPSALAACGGGATCDDTSGLSSAEIATRQQQAYADLSADPNKKCSLCRHFTASQSGGCGTCAVLRGPIAADGSCNLFTARA